MTKLSPFRYFKTSPEIIRLAVMLYVRFPLSLRNVEDLLQERGIEVSHETVRYLWQRFGPMFAAEIRRKRVSGMRASHWRWQLDEVFVRINGVQHYLWRAVDHEGEVLEAFVSKTRDKAAALKFLKKLIKRHGRPEELVTDKLKSYGAALNEIGAEEGQVTDHRENNRAEHSHQPFSTTRASHAPLPLNAESAEVRLGPLVSLQPLQRRTEPLKPTGLKRARTAALAEWRQLCAA